ncbi:MAG: porin [Candidatus Zixiibacteriota bacterium]|jgi:hypothetical protein
MIRKITVLALLLGAAYVPALADYEVVTSTHGNLILSGYAIGRYTYVQGDPEVPGNEATSTFSLRSASLIFHGDIFKYAGYCILVDGVASPALIDGFGTLNVIPNTEFKMGQFLVPFSRESCTSTSKLLLIDRTAVSTAIAPPLGRDVGAQFEYSLKPEGKPYWGAFALAGINGAGPNTADDNRAKDVALRVMGNPCPWEDFAPLTLEGYYYFGRPELGMGVDATGRRYGVAAAFDHERFTVQTEYLGREVTVDFAGVETSISAGGYYLQASYKHPLPWEWLQIVEPAARFESFDPNDSQPDDGVGAITGGVNLHFDPGHHCKFMANYERVTEEGPDVDNDVISGQFQIRF